MHRKQLTCCLLLLIIGISFSCEELVSIDEPSDRLIRNQVFNSDETAISAMTGIYNELYQSAFSGGSFNSVTVLGGLSSDNVKNISITNLERLEFDQHEIDPLNGSNLDLWTSAYNIIYMTNSFLKGIETSNNISPELKLQLEGEARFVRAFTFFQLINLYGEVPLILSTNYSENLLAERSSINSLNAQIIDDLSMAGEMLSIEYRTGEKTSVNRLAAKALLARVYLYQQVWDKAAQLSSEVIESNIYNLSDDLNNVFLANSQEALWQISPIGGGGIASNTSDGNLFIIDPFFYFFATLKLDENFVTQFDAEDNRLVNWIGFNDPLSVYFSNKYKIQSSTQFPILEYSMVLRLAEQYLIRAEANAMQGDISASVDDINVIRKRAGLEPLESLTTEYELENILDEIYNQRRKELFTEWGHRWFDLKRSGRTEVVFGPSATWQPTDIYYPIPEEELIKNPNLDQNDGY